MTTTTEKPIDQEIAEFRAKVDAYETANPTAVFLGYDRLVCFKCAGMTLQADIAMNPRKRNFYGMRDEIFTKLSESNRQDMRDAYAPDTAKCECGKVVL